MKKLIILASMVFFTMEISGSKNYMDYKAVVERLKAGGMVENVYPVIEKSGGMILTGTLKDTPEKFIEDVESFIVDRFSMTRGPIEEDPIKINLIKLAN